LWQHEQNASDAGFLRIAGIDEAGRGPLAGPVVAACVCLRVDVLALFDGLTDSKKLAPRKRLYYADRIRKHALAYGIGTASVEEIDSLNILQATFLAMKRALAEVDGVDHLLVDGVWTIPGLTVKQTPIIRGDGSSYSIAAASVLAKVTRDQMMVEWAAKLPGYGFERHKGYPTQAHYEAIARLGVSEIHRQTFLKR